MGSELNLTCIDIVQVDADVLLASLGSIGVGIEGHGVCLAERWSLELRTLFAFEYQLLVTVSRVVEVKTRLGE